jgi:hypothetical protein
MGRGEAMAPSSPGNAGGDTGGSGPGTGNGGNYGNGNEATSLLWRASARHPIPDEWRTVGPRYSRAYSASRNASHPVNAILNYAYAVLPSQVQIKAAVPATIRCSG